MPSAGFIAAARAASREPVLLMAVEGIDTIKVASTTKADWEAAKTSSNVNTNTFPGDIVCATDGSEVYSGVYTTGKQTATEETINVQLVNDTVYTSSILSPDDRITGVYAHLTTFELGNGTAVATLQTSPDDSTWTDRGTLTITDGTPTMSFLTLTKGEYYVRLKLVCTARSGIFGASLTWDDVTWQYETIYLDASLQTFSLDLGVTPTIDSIFSADDVVPSGCTLTYTARGSDDDSSWTDLGTVEDGDPLDPYRYYDVTAAFTTNDWDTPRLKEISVSGGDSSMLYFSTHRHTPAGTWAEPLLQKSIGSVGSKLELMKLGSTGEVSPKLHYLRPTFELLRDGYLRNKSVSVKLGFNNGMAETEYEPLFVGQWYDASISLKNATIDVKTRSILERFKKVKLPIETASGAARNDTTVVPITWTNEHICDVCLDIFDQMGIAGRYIDTASFTDLYGTGGPLDHASNWDVTRTLDKDSKADAIKLLEELSCLGGFFIVQGRDGKMRAKYYDPAAAAVANIPARICSYNDVQLAMAELFTRQQIYYGQIAGTEGSSAEDFDNAYILINAAAEIAWGLNDDLPDTDPDYLKNPGYMKEFFDKWNASSVAIAALASRMDGWFATPKMRLTVSDLPPQYLADDNDAELGPGCIVTLSGLQLPLSGETWGTPCDQVKFLILKSDFNVQKMTVSFDLMEV